MKFLAISESGHALGLLMRLQKEGHSTHILSNQDFGSGIIDPLVDNSVSDITIFDSNSLGAKADSMRKEGRRVLGASKWSHGLESNLEYSESLIKSAGWSIATGSRGINLYITAWFNGKDYISVYSSLVYRRFMSSGRGPDLNFTGVISLFGQEKVDKIRTTFLNPLLPILKRTNHRGCFHIHALISETGYGVKSISASFENPLSIFLFENTRLSACDVLLKMFDESSTPIMPVTEWGAGVMLSVPPYPYVLHTPSKKEISGIEQANLKHLWLVDIIRENNSYYTGLVNGKIGYVTARGATSPSCWGYTEATRRIYRTISNLSVQDLQYRDDVGDKISDMLYILSREKWIKYALRENNSKLQLNKAAIL